MIVGTSEIQFRIDVDFDGCDVDMVYNEARAAGIQTPVPTYLTGDKPFDVDKHKLPQTPSSASVEFALLWLMGYVDRNEMCIKQYKWHEQTELEALGVDVKEIYGLMMGTCHLIISVQPEKFSPKLVEECQKIVAAVMERFVRYYDGDSEDDEEDYDGEE